MRNALELIYIDILDFHHHALRFFSGKCMCSLERSYSSSNLISSEGGTRFFAQCGRTLTQSSKASTRFVNTQSTFFADCTTAHSGILNCLRRHKELVETRAHLAYYQNYQDDMNRHQQEIAEIKKSLERDVIEEQKKKLAAIKEWLGVGSITLDDHDTFLEVRKRYQSTGRWILNHDTIDNWMNADIPNSSIVWMTGIPGAGAYCPT